MELLVNMDENSDVVAAISAIAAATATLAPVADVATATTRPLRGEKNSYFSNFFKIYNKTYFFSSSFQITFLHNYSTFYV